MNEKMQTLIAAMNNQQWDKARNIITTIAETDYANWMAKNLFLFAQGILAYHDNQQQINETVIHFLFNQQVKSFSLKDAEQFFPNNDNQQMIIAAAIYQANKLADTDAMAAFEFLRRNKLAAAHPLIAENPDFMPIYELMVLFAFNAHHGLRYYMLKSLLISGYQLSPELEALRQNTDFIQFEAEIASLKDNEIKNDTVIFNQDFQLSCEFDSMGIVKYFYPEFKVKKWIFKKDVFINGNWNEQFFNIEVRGNAEVSGYLVCSTNFLFKKDLKTGSYLSTPGISAYNQRSQLKFNCYGEITAPLITINSKKLNLKGTINPDAIIIAYAEDTEIPGHQVHVREKVDKRFWDAKTKKDAAEDLLYSNMQIHFDYDALSAAIINGERIFI